VHGGAACSAVVIRVSKDRIIGGQTITAPQNTAKGYLYYFATVSGKTKGIRTAAGHYADVGTSFSLHVSLRHDLQSSHATLLQNALALFLRYGSLGLRATRGCGAFTATPILDMKDSALEKFAIGSISSERFETGLKCQIYLGNVLQKLRHDNHLSAKYRTALGYSMGPGSRCASALKLRPVEIDTGVFAPYVIYSDTACRESSLKELVESLLGR